jgi:hypothetical protein
VLARDSQLSCAYVSVFTEVGNYEEERRMHVRAGKAAVAEEVKERL